MKQTFSRALVVLAMLGATVAVKGAEPCCLQLPATPNNQADALVTVTYGNAQGTGIAPEFSLFTIDIQGTPTPPIPAGRYAGWCFDSVTDISPAPGGTLFGGRLYSTCDPTVAFNQELPDHPGVKVDAATWKRINYLINHRLLPCDGLVPTMWEVQRAIYILFDQTPPPTPPYPPFRPQVVECLTNAAYVNAPSWQLGCGDKVAVIFNIEVNWDNVDPEIQLIFLEVPCCPTPTLIVPPGNDLGCRPQPPTCSDLPLATASDCTGNVPVVCTPGPITSTGNCGKSRTFTYTATNVCGKGTSGTATYTWKEDMTGPTLGNVPASQDLGCNPTLPSCAAVTARDTCDGDLTASVVCTPGAITDVGTCGKSQTFTYKVQDSCMNEATASVTYTWKEDKTKPVLGNVPASRDLGCNPPLPTCEAVTAMDICDGDLTASVVCTPGAITDVGTCGKSQTFTYKVEDACKNEATATVTYTWKVDTMGPVVTCPADIVVDLPFADCAGGKTVTYTSTATDDCDGPRPVTCDPPSGTRFFSTGTVTVTCTAEDLCGNPGQCSFLVRVTCQSPPKPTLECAANSGQVGVLYSSALVASGGVPPYTFSIIAGSLPPGLMLNPATGAITGIPTEAGNFAFVAQVVDSAGGSDRIVTANCSITIIGVGGCRVTGGSNHQLNSQQSPCITTPLPSHISHGGQVGAPFSVETPFFPNSPCISGEWQHNRHLRGNSLVGNFHASGNGNQRQFDSLLCACLPCDENPNAVGVVGGTCNPGDRICGPEPRRAPANKICFSGVGDYTFTTGRKTVKAVFRVDIEDRSEGNSQSSSPPPDRYRIRLWLLDPSCGRNPDPNSAEAMTLRFAASADPATIATLATTENLKVNIPPDIDDGGNMTQGNHQIHPATGAQCGAFVPPPVAHIDVTTEISGMTAAGACTFGKHAKGHQGIQDPAFVYRIHVINSGAVTLTNLSVTEMTDTTFADTTPFYFAPGTTLPPGGSATRYYTNVWGLDTITTAKVTGNSSENGALVVAASTAMASVGAAALDCSMTLSSTCDLDGNPNDNHLQLTPGTGCQVQLNLRICNTGQSDLTGVTVNNTGWPCSWPTFDLPHGACINLSCVTTLSCPSQPIVPQVTVTGNVQPDCIGSACSVSGTTITVSTNCSGRVESCVPLAAGPTGLKVTSGNAKVTLTWSALSGATSYKVKRSLTREGPYTTIKTGLATTSYTDSTVANGTVYYYVVSAMKAGAETADSSALSAIPAAPAPSPWSTKDIGSVATVGGASYSNGTFSVIGSGVDIWNTADGFRFIYQSGKGDCSIVAKVLSVQNTDPWAKVGVMIRETLNANSTHAFMCVTPGNGVAFQSRLTTGGTSVNVNTTGLAAPYWVKIVRNGRTFTGYRSSDGAAWTQVGSQTISMGQNVYIGLGVTSHTNGTLCNGILSNVTATP